jgi:drug/metabolite transporter (DMT)-like permease
MPPRLTGNLIVLLCMVLWASNFPVTERLLEDWHPLLLVAPRLGVAALFLLGLMVLAGQTSVLRRVRWGEIVRVGGLGLGVSTTLLVWGQHYSNPVSVAIIVTTMPIVSAVMGLMDGRERVTVLLSLGIAAAIAGGILASLPPDGASPDFRGGEILVAASVFGFTWFTRVAVFRLADLPDIAKTALMMTMATLVVALAAIVGVASGTVEARYEVSLPAFGMFLWLGCASNGGSMLLWLMGARRLGVTVAAIHLNGVPFYVILMALVVGGSIYTSQVWGACLVAAGALLAQWPGLGRAKRVASPAPE